MRDTILIQENDGQIDVGTIGNMNGNEVFTKLLAVILQLSIVNNISEDDLLAAVKQGYEQILDAAKES